MLFILLAGALLTGLARRGKVSNLAKIHLMHPWLIFLSILLEISLIMLSRYNVALAWSFVFMFISIQYIFLLAFIWVNRHLPYSRLIWLGSFLNCLVILLNKGTMPLAPAYLNLNRAKLSYDFLVNGNLPLYHIIDENTVLWFLGDIIRIPYPFSAFMSIGDIILYAGVFLMLQSLIAGKRA